MRHYLILNLINLFSLWNLIKLTNQIQDQTDNQAVQNNSKTYPKNQTDQTNNQRNQFDFKPFICNKKEIKKLKDFSKINRFVVRGNVFYLQFDDKIIKFESPFFKAQSTNSSKQLFYFRKQNYVFEINRYPNHKAGKKMVSEFRYGPENRRYNYGPINRKVSSTQQKIYGYISNDHSVIELEKDTKNGEIILKKYLLDFEKIPFDRKPLDVIRPGDVNFFLEMYKIKLENRLKKNETKLNFVYEFFDKTADEYLVFEYDLINGPDNTNHKQLNLILYNKSEEIEKNKSMKLNYDVEWSAFTFVDGSLNSTNHLNILIEIDSQLNLHIAKLDLKAIKTSNDTHFSKEYEIIKSLNKFLNCHQPFKDFNQLKGIIFDYTTKQFIIFIDNFYIQVKEDIVENNFLIENSHYEDAKDLFFDLDPKSEIYNDLFDDLGTKWAKQLNGRMLLTSFKNVWNFSIDNGRNNFNLVKNQEFNYLQKCKKSILKIKKFVFCFEEKIYYQIYPSLKTEFRRIKDLFDKASISFENQTLELIFNYKKDKFIFMTHTHLFVINYNSVKFINNSVLFFDQKDHNILEYKNCILTCDQSSSFFTTESVLGFILIVLILTIFVISIVLMFINKSESEKMFDENLLKSSSSQKSSRQDQKSNSLFLTNSDDSKQAQKLNIPKLLNPNEVLTSKNERMAYSIQKKVVRDTDQINKIDNKNELFRSDILNESKLEDQMQISNTGFSSFDELKK